MPRRWMVALFVAVLTLLPQAARGAPPASTPNRGVLEEQSPSNVTSDELSAGAAHQAIADYERAAESYERYASHAPAAAHAERALSDAVLLRLGLGDAAKATEDALLYLKTYGATRPLQAAAITFALAVHHAEHEEWKRARGVLTGSAAAIERGPVDVQMQALALSARLHLRDHAPARARDEYAKVRRLWSDPSAAEASIRSAWSTEPDAADRRVARALNAVGEATFAAAEERRVAEVQVLKLPAYVGAKDRASVLAHVQTKVKPWFEAKLRAIEGVESALVAILDLKPVAPPRWVIHAAAAVAFMWGDFADDLGRVPIPEAWRRDRALYTAYYAAADDMIGSIKSAHAKPAARKCIELAAKFEFFDPKARACEAWLAANDPSYHPVDELLPTFRNGPRFAEPRPLPYDEAPERP